MVELISIHVPKTAGTAFRHILLDVYGNQGVLADYPPNKIYNLENPVPDRVKAIHGHFRPANKYDHLFPDAKKIVWLRHPIFRLISEYFFAKTINDRENAIHRELLDNNLGILEFAKIPGMVNFQSKYIQGLELTDFDFVGIQEFYLEDLQDLQALMGWHSFQPSVKNSNRYPEYNQCLREVLCDKNLVSELAMVNNKDMEIYDQALKMRAKRRQESEYVQSTLADWSRSQFLFEQGREEFNKLKAEVEQSRYWLQNTHQPVEAVEIINRRQVDVADVLLGFCIDSPKSPAKVENGFVTISGWVIGKDSPAVMVRVACNNTVVCEVPVDKPREALARVFPVPEAQQSGFEAVVVIPPLSSNSVLNVEVVLANQTQVKIGLIKTSNLVISK